MSDIHPAGVYEGKIVDANMALAYQSETDLVLVLEVDTVHGYVTCKHNLFNKKPGDVDKTKEVFANIGLDWPNGIDDPKSVIDKEVEVYVGHFTTEKGETKCYGKINVGGSANTPEAVAKAVKKFLGNDDVPF